MDAMFNKHGAVSWTELLTTDVEAAKKFYGTLFGWTFTSFAGAGMPYEVASIGDRQFGGIFKPPANAPECVDSRPSWTSYVTVENVDETAKNAKELGGKILMGPMDIPTVGRFCLIQDPQGAVLAAITYAPMTK